MGLYGKNDKSIRKKDVLESKSKAIAFEVLRFAHQATAGETGINLGTLTLPSDMSAGGFTNPSPTKLNEANLFRYKESITLVSSLRGELIQNSSFTIQGNSRIAFRGFTAEEGEFFVGTIAPTIRNGVQVLDAKVQTASGDLADGATDFVLGFATPTNKEELIVFRNGLAQTRNSNNSSTTMDGNYYIVDAGSGYGTVVRFNNAASGQDDAILATAVGNIIESPVDSTFTALEVLQGQIDSIVPTVADLAGVPQTDFQANPNNIDQKQFGDRVIALEEPGVGGPKLATVSNPGALKKNKLQTKFLNSPLASTTIDIPDLRFNNLTIGKIYEVTVQVSNLGGTPGTFSASHNSSYILTLADKVGTIDSNDRWEQNGSVKFVATTTTLRFDYENFSEGASLEGNGNPNTTYVQLEERNDLVLTTDFT